MRFTVISVFPQIVDVFCAHGLVGQACAKNLVQVRTVNPRSFTTDAHQSVDDRAFGGGDGMVMKAEPLAEAVTRLRAEGPVKVVVLSPQGRVWNQADAVQWAGEGGHVALICGRYAGIDHRFTVQHADDEISLGDFVLNGGEIAACAVLESVVRLRPGVLGNEISASRDSFSAGLLECPQFTRPREIFGLPVPEVLLSGHHERIAKFESAVSLVRTALLRPDLLPSPVPGLELAVTAILELEDGELRSLGLTRADLIGLQEGNEHEQR
ncbi:MAG: tRNA (guanosine(37)-N1)-methyltransferase TrmD [Bdellovibrionales bacterium]